jgi:hypothetical protein
MNGFGLFVKEALYKIFLRFPFLQNLASSLQVFTRKSGGSTMFRPQKRA